MLLSHADATGRDVAEVGRQPYARTLWAYYRRREHEAMREIAAKSDRLELASFVGLAFGNPAGLEEQHQTLRAKIADLAGAAPVVLSRAQAMAAARELWERVKADEAKAEAETAAERTKPPTE